MSFENKISMLEMQNNICQMESPTLHDWYTRFKNVILEFCLLGLYNLDWIIYIFFFVAENGKTLTENGTKCLKNLSEPKYYYYSFSLLNFVFLKTCPLIVLLFWIICPWIIRKFLFVIQKSHSSSINSYGFVSFQLQGVTLKLHSGMKTMSIISINIGEIICSQQFCPHFHEWEQKSRNSIKFL